MIDTKIKARLLKKALRSCSGGTILPCGNKKSLEECFTRSPSHYIFWFNTDVDCSTRAVLLPVTALTGA